MALNYRATRCGLRADPNIKHQTNETGKMKPCSRQTSVLEQKTAPSRLKINKKHACVQMRVLSLFLLSLAELGQNIHLHIATMKQGLPFSELHIQLRAGKDIKGCSTPGISRSRTLSRFLLLSRNPHRISQHIKP